MTELLTQAAFMVFGVALPITYFVGRLHGLKKGQEKLPTPSPTPPAREYFTCGCTHDVGMHKVTIEERNGVEYEVFGECTVSAMRVERINGKDTKIGCACNRYSGKLPPDNRRVAPL